MCHVLDGMEDARRNELSPEMEKAIANIVDIDIHI